MALNINGQGSPKEILFNGEDVKILVVDETAIWQKPFTLTMSSDENSTLTVKRTSSLNPDATIGNLSNGATIYYNDKLEVTTSFNSGYKFNSLTINSSSWSEDPGTRTITVTTNQAISLTSVVSVGWKTVSGSQYLDGSYEFDLSEFPIATDDLEVYGIADVVKEVNTGIYVADKFSSGTKVCFVSEVYMDYDYGNGYSSWQIDSSGKITSSSIDIHTLPYQEEFFYEYNGKDLSFFYDNYTIRDGYLWLRFRWVYDGANSGYTLDTMPMATGMLIRYLAYYG